MITELGKSEYGTALYGLCVNRIFLLKKVYFQAKGQVAKLIIYRYNGRYGRQDVYPYVLGENPKTEAQQANRVKFKEAMAAWKVLPEEDKALFEHRVINRKMCGKNLFVKEYMKDLI
jgi:hypothetical protein